MMVERESFPSLPSSLLFPPSLINEDYYTGQLFEQYSRQKSPEAYDLYPMACYVSLLSILSARRLQIPFNTPEYTPLNVILAGEPGVAKTVTAGCVYNVLDSIDMGWMLEASNFTPQSLIREMAGWVTSDYNLLDSERQRSEETCIAFSGQRGIYSGEFGEFVSQITDAKGPLAAFMGLVLEMDDCKPTYKVTTIARNKEIIKDPFLSILGCMTASSIKDTAKQGSKLYSNGFWSRMLVCCAPASETKNCPFTEGIITVPLELSRRLSAWHQGLGVPYAKIEPIMEEKKGELAPTGGYTVTRDDLPITTMSFAPFVLDAWTRYRSFLKNAVLTLAYPDLKSNYVRLPSRAIRIAALLASVEGHTEIQLCHWAKAQEITEYFRYGIHEMYRQVNHIVDIPPETIEDVILATIERCNSDGIQPTSREMQQKTDKLRGKAKQIEEALKYLLKDGEIVEIRDGRKSTYRAVSPLEKKG